MSTVICSHCRAAVRDPYEVFEQRIELRAKKTQSRYRVLLLGLLCRECADDLVEQHRPSPASNQTELFA